MKVKLIRHSLPDRPDWVIMDESVPLGTEYEVLGYESRMELHSSELNESRIIEAYFLDGNGDKGFMPAGLFERIEE